MPIPNFDHNNVLPPYLGDVTQAANMSPYRVGIMEVVQRFATSPERVTILHGLISLRSDLRAIGISAGFQWLDGSFVEDVEVLRGCPPGDIDVVTFHSGVQGTPDPAIVARLSNHGVTKATYLVDHYLIALGSHPFHLIDSTRFWFGLFSHQKKTDVWKGMIHLDLMTDVDDNDARNYLNGRTFP